VTKKTIAIIATAPVAVKFHLEAIVEYLKQNYTVIILTNLSNDQDNLINTLPRDVEYFNTEMERDIGILKDIKTLVLLFKFFKKKNIDIAFTITPKGGLIGNLASLMVGIPIRIHVYTGQVWKIREGFLRYVLMFFDKLIYVICTKVLIDSKSQRDFLIRNRIIKEKKSLVLGEGSLSGVDTDRFSPNLEHREIIREKHNVSSDDIVFLFVGRLNEDKGIPELLESFSKLRDSIKNTSLWLMGPVEMDLVPLKQKIDEDTLKSILFLPYSPKPELYMAAADIFCLPSLREGFGTVIIESAACGIPAIGTNIYGLNDAIQDGKTGYLVEIGNSIDFVSVMIKLAEDQALRYKMGGMARKIAKQNYSQAFVVERLASFLNNEIYQLSDKK